MACTVRESQVPRELAQGAVRIWHIVFFYFVIFLSTATAASIFTRSADPAYRQAWSSFITQCLIAISVIALTLAVPEMRKSVRALYGPRKCALAPIDVALFMGVMITWTLGAARVLLLFPALHWRPEWFAFLGLFEQYREPGPLFMLLWLAGSSLLAPFAEELFFRGYLQNLLDARWGLWPAVLISAFVFGTAHLQWTPIAMVSGIFLSLVYLRFGSLWPGTLLHGLYNATVSSFGIGPLFAVKDKTHVGEISSWIPELALTIAFFPLIYLFWRRFRPVN